MNSMAEQEVNINATQVLRILVLPTQHSITRSRVSFAHVTSSGNSSKSSRDGEWEECEFKTISYSTSPTAEEGDASEKMEGREEMKHQKKTRTLNHFCHSRPGQRQLVFAWANTSLSVGHG